MWRRSNRISEKLEESKEYINETTYYWDEVGVIIFRKSEKDRIKGKLYIGRVKTH